MVQIKILSVVTNLINSMCVKLQDKCTNENPNLSPDLTDLVLKPPKDKICRPPNAFLLFAKEGRGKLGEIDPSLTNGDRSSILGSMWKGMSDEEKEKYYMDAKALQKLHKETYPGEDMYVFRNW